VFPRGETAAKEFSFFLAPIRHSTDRKSMDGMRVTVGICTWNRADLLDQTLASLCKLVIPADVQWEVLVIDNHCTDHTPEVTARHAQQLPLRVIRETRPGKSQALNTAVAHLQGELVLWTDDDVIVQPQWLAAYVSASRRFPQASFFGGPIEPWFEVPPPDWMRRVWPRIAAAFATRDLGDSPFPLDHRRLPFGANFAVRIPAQRKYPYDTRLGPQGRMKTAGEETAVILHMLEDGLSGYWIPEARLQHFIPRERLSTTYLRNFYYGLGRTDAVCYSDERLRARLQVSRARGWYRAMFAEARYQLMRRLASPERWIRDLSKCSYYWGRLDGDGWLRSAGQTAEIVHSLQQQVHTQPTRRHKQGARCDTAQGL
jgi:glycosyltransferase involved in cell wall biosynthesis